MDIVSWGRYGSIPCAFRAFDFLKEYSLGERDGTLTEFEVCQCFDAPPKQTLRIIGRPYHVVDIWEKAKYVRVRDFRQWAGAHKNRIRYWKKKGLLKLHYRDWYPKTGLIPLDEALFLKKCLMLIPWVRVANGAYLMDEMESLATLPLKALLGLLVQPQLLGLMFTCLALFKPKEKTDD